MASLTVSRTASPLSLADLVDLQTRGAERDLPAPLYSAIRERLEAPALRCITGEAAALERGEVAAHYARGREVRVRRLGAYAVWREEKPSGEVVTSYREIRGL